MKKILIYSLVLVLTGCEQQVQAPIQPQQTAQTEENKQQVVQANQPHSSSLGDRMLESAAAGAAGGAAAGVAHAATSHAINSFSKKRRAARISRARSRRR